MKTPKYDTLAELKAAYDSGELSRDYPVTLDNDCCFVYDENDNCVWRSDEPPQAELLTQALEMLNIPCEDV